MDGRKFIDAAWNNMEITPKIIEVSKKIDPNQWHPPDPLLSAETFNHPPPAATCSPVTHPLIKALQYVNPDSICHRCGTKQSPLFEYSLCLTFLLCFCNLSSVLPVLFFVHQSISLFPSPDQHSTSAKRLNKLVFYCSYSRASEFCFWVRKFMRPLQQRL